MSGSSQQPPCLTGVAADLFLDFFKNGGSCLAIVANNREHFSGKIGSGR